MKEIILIIGIRGICLVKRGKVKQSSVVKVLNSCKVLRTEVLKFLG